MEDRLDNFLQLFAWMHANDVSPSDMAAAFAVDGDSSVVSQGDVAVVRHAHATEGDVGGVNDPPTVTANGHVRSDVVVQF